LVLEVFSLTTGQAMLAQSNTVKQWAMSITAIPTPTRTAWLWDEDYGVRCVPEKSEADENQPKLELYRAKSVPVRALYSA
jgi:hypothetical protein